METARGMEGEEGMLFWRLSLVVVCIFRGSIVVSISACHAEDPGSIPGRGVYLWCDGLVDDA